jgi:hypothetical protein
LIGHGDHESIQFGEARKKVPLIAKITWQVLKSSLSLCYKLIT